MSGHAGMELRIDARRGFSARGLRIPQDLLWYSVQYLTDPDMKRTKNRSLRWGF